MKIGRGNTSMVLALSSLEYEDVVRNLKLQNDQRPRVTMRVIDADHVSLRFSATEGAALYQQATNTSNWQAQADLKVSGATALNTFGQTEVTLRNGKAAGEIIATLPTQRRVLMQRVKRTSPIVVKKARGPANNRTVVSGKASSTRPATDTELLRLKQSLNGVLAQGFMIKFDEAGHVEYFERRIG